LRNLALSAIQVEWKSQGLRAHRQEDILNGEGESKPEKLTNQTLLENAPKNRQANLCTKNMIAV